ncbi:hypothetical protein DER45DRAFT_610960 [Fusarium avenaceum]|nr:hypothetical protein DER45DRAFT_610960 [Fusarium avenaceum]
MSVLQVGNDADRPHDESKNPMWRIAYLMVASETPTVLRMLLQELAELDDDWAEYLPHLENFPCERFGNVIPRFKVEKEELVQDKVDGAASHTKQ